MSRGFEQLRFSGSDMVHAIGYGFREPRTRCGLSMREGHRRVAADVTCRVCRGRTPRGAR